MRILFLTAHLPYPPASGGRRREFELIARLSKNFEIYLCALTEAPEIDNNNFVKILRNYCDHVKIFKTEPIPLADNSFGFPSLMKRYYSKEGFNGISQLIKSSGFDIIHVEGSYLMQLIPEDCPLPILLVEHNIEYSLCVQRLKLAVSERDKLFYRQEHNNTLLWEQSFWSRAKKVIVLALEDEKCIRELDPGSDVAFIPNGVDHDLAINQSGVHSQTQHNIIGSVSEDIAKYITENCPSILFVANFAYDPNIDAAIYFCKQIFPLILQDVPDAKLFLVGNSPPKEILELASSSSHDTNTGAMAYTNIETISNSIEIVGYVNSLQPFYKFAKVVVCPLRIGGGVKVKILEALKTGKAIVTTPIGAQGFGLNSGALCVCNEVSDFANNVVRFLINSNDREAQEERALSYASTLPAWDQVIEQYATYYRGLVSSESIKISNKTLPSIVS
jgi:glycosyltransferase involved in cell wall biosynthesis